MQGKVVLRPDELTLFRELIDYRERGHLAGRYDDDFLVAFAGNEGDMTHSAIVGSRSVSMRTLRRFEKLGLIDVLNRTDAAIAFDLADDFRDRWPFVQRAEANVVENDRHRPSGVQESQPSRKASSASSDIESAAGSVFISCSELQKERLAVPFRALLAQSGVQGFIVSDEPRPDTAWTPEEKVDAYLEMSDAVVVFATGDVEAGDDRYAKPNIADEIARARSKLHLRDRVCVLKEGGVSLPSNINPAYEALDPSSPEPAMRRALLQLREWGLPVTVLPEAPSGGGQSVAWTARAISALDHELTPEQQHQLVSRARTLVPDRRHTMGEMSLAVVVVGGPRTSLLRPSELESSAFADDLVRQALSGRPPLMDPREGTEAAMSGESLVVRQAHSWLGVDAEGSLVVVRPAIRDRRGRAGLSAVIEEDVRNDIADVLRFASQLLERLDTIRRLSHVVPVAALLGANYGAWRTRHEQEASPHSMAMNISISDVAVAVPSPPAHPMADLMQDSTEIAEDLMVLLRRAATR